jgi:pimeloyl-ACP methyl ester carboxylesterase
MSTKPPILLLHGALGSAKTFDKLRILLSENYNVYTFDFQGHGSQSAYDKPLTMEGFRTQWIDFMDAHQLKSTHIFGYSLGGYVGMYLAQHHPEKVLSLFTMGTKWDWTEVSAQKETAFLNPAKMQEKVPKFTAQLAAIHGETRWVATVNAVRNFMLESGKSPIFSEADFKNIQIPVMIGVGDRDVTGNLDATIKVYRALPNAQFFVAPNTPHAFERADILLIFNVLRIFHNNNLNQK